MGARDDEHALAVDRLRVDLHVLDPRRGVNLDASQLLRELPERFRRVAAIVRVAGRLPQIAGVEVRGPRIFAREDSRFFNKKYLDKTHAYFEKYGVKTIIIARFVPIVRTITPFVAGIGAMDYKRKFLPFDIFGGALWIGLLLLAGFLFGQHPFVQKNYETVILAIVFISVLPMLIEFVRHRNSRKA